MQPPALGLTQAATKVTLSSPLSPPLFLCHPRKTVTKIQKKFHRQITCVRDTSAVSITPIPLWGNEAWRCRYVFGYSLDDSDKPGLRERRAMAFGSLMQRGDTIITYVRLPASRTLVWNTSMQPLALAVLGISGPPQHMLLASASIP